MKCEMCGGIATEPPHGEAMLCAACQDRYESYICRQCGGRVITLKGMGTDNMCGACTTRAKFSALSRDQQESIRGIVGSGRILDAVIAMRGVGLSLLEAKMMANDLRPAMALKTSVIHAPQ